MEFFDQIAVWFADMFGDFVNPKKRIFVGYLLLSVLIGLLWLVAVRRVQLHQALAKVFDRKVFFSKSSQADYKIFVINRLFSFFISPLLITQIFIATAIFHLLHSQSFVAVGALENVSAFWVVAGFSVTLFIVDDFTKYLVHMWMHRYPFLWSLHKVHHSATTLTPVTVYRVHPLEGVLYALRSSVAQGVTLSLFFFLFGGGKVDIYAVVGVNVLVFFFHVSGSNLRHSHVNIRYWKWLEHILISPAQHQLHHSVAEKHYDKNFGVALAVWDWLFGSLHLSEEEEELEFGLEPGETPWEADLKTIYLRPFAEMWAIAARNLRRLGRGIMWVLRLPLNGLRRLRG